MKSTNLTPSSGQKPKPNHLDEFLPFYKKLGKSYAELEDQNKTSDKSDSSRSSKVQPESPKHQRSSSKRQAQHDGHEKHAVDISQIIIDGSNLNTSGGRSTPVNLNKSKATSTPLVSTKKTTKFDEVKFKKNASTIEHDNTADDVSANISNSKSKKRVKSVSFLLEESDQAVVKKTKSVYSQVVAATGDPPNKVTKHKNKSKKNNKSEKENKVVGDQTNVVEPAAEKKDKKFKKKAVKSQTGETPVLYVNETGQGDNVAKDKKYNKQVKGKKQENPAEQKSNQVTEKTKKAKKQKHQDKPDIDENEGEPASKTPKTETIANNLENLNLGDNTHTLANLINEMAVVDKAKQKKLRKTANKEKKQFKNDTGDKDLNVTCDKELNVTGDKDLNVTGDKDLNVTGDTEKGVQVEKKKWVKKRWNKRQIVEKDQNTTINVDNLPVSLLKGNFKKVLIDHFSKYGLSRSVGEPIIQNEDDSNAVFTTKVYFDTAIAAAEALQMDGTTVAGNEIQVSQMRPMTETAIVLRMYGPPEKLNNKDISVTFRDMGLIRSIRPILKKKKTMSTVFVEFDGPETVERALQKCVNLTINGIKVMASQFVVINMENKDKNDKKKKRKRSNKNKKGTNKDSEKAPNKASTKPSNKDSDSGDESDDD